MESAPAAARPQDEEAQLVRRILDAPPGEASEVEGELCRRLAPRLRLYGLRHLRDEHAADDLAQQVLLIVIEALRSRKLRDPEKLASFALGSCRMLVLDQRRSAQRRQQLLDQFAAELPAGAGYCEPPLDRPQLARCLESLKERERSVVILTFYEEQSSESVAGSLGLSPGNVRVLRHRAMEQLRACMTARGSRA